MGGGWMVCSVADVCLPSYEGGEEAATPLMQLVGNIPSCWLDCFVTCSMHSTSSCCRWRRTAVQSAAASAVSTSGAHAAGRNE
jgi:hypothetical protein